MELSGWTRCGEWIAEMEEDGPGVFRSLCKCMSSWLGGTRQLDFQAGNALF